MRRTPSSATLAESKCLRTGPPPTLRGSPSRSAGMEWQQRPRERGRRRDIQGSVVRLRILTVLCVLGGCLLFRGTVPELRDTLIVHPMDTSPDACAAVLSSPKVALLFLTKGRMVHHEIWESWLERATGLLPAEHLGPKLCDGGGGEGVVTPSQISDACSSQHLFSLYLHLSKELDADELLGPGWIEYTKNITRVITLWGHHSLVEATRNLLAAAFEDPANERFVLLSETHVPLWDPLSVYRVLTNERRSSINASPHDDMDLQRWTKKMAPVVPSTNWRKSQQWWTLVRSHVEAVLDDSEIYRAFREHCRWELMIDMDNFYHRKCFSDEHYFPTCVMAVPTAVLKTHHVSHPIRSFSSHIVRLLSIKGLEHETIPVFATTTYVEWLPGEAHPRSFQPEDVTSELFAKTLRSHEACPLSSFEQHRLVQTSQESFIPAEALDGGDMEAICGMAMSHSRNAELASLPGECTTFARKFGQNTVNAVRSVLEAELII